MAKILFIGDIIGKPGRKALREVLPMWKEQYKPDAVVVNVENIAHGKGVTMNTLTNIEDLGIDCYTTGNHVYDKGELSNECFEKVPKLIRPVNYPENLPGTGYYRFAKNGQQFLVINVNGTVFFERQFDGQITNAFLAMDKVLSEQSQKGDIILVDFHSEATSEKNALGWYLDGRVAGVFGTHTHVPTFDWKILPKGTAYVSDTGMTGAKNSVIGVKVENSLDLLLGRKGFVMDIAEDGPIMVNGIYIETENEKAVKIEKLYKEV